MSKTKKKRKVKKASKPQGPPCLVVKIPLAEVDNYIKAFLTSQLPANVASGYATKLQDGKNRLLILGEDKK